MTVYVGAVKDEVGEPWFVAKDVCDVLDIGNVTDTVRRLDEDEKGITINDTPGGPQKMITVNEPGLYSLILQSRKPEAKTFKRWVVHEVLPSVRKHGGYLTPEKIEEILGGASPPSYSSKATTTEDINYDRIIGFD